jgi:serine/threonine protein kinase
MADYAGQQLGPYRLERLLGEGSFAQVYLATHEHLHTQVAIKLLRSVLLSEASEQFRREAQTIAHLVHPHIVRVFDFGFHDGLPYLVMDYLPGGSLRQRYPRGTRLPLATAIGYVRQAASALQYAHQARIVHRDVKPENMLLDRDGSLRLADFGIATIAESTRSSASPAQALAGTITYMAPEQIQARPRPASDQYALAVVLYEWLCGRPPFEGTFVEVAVKHSTMAVPPLRTFLPELPPVIEQIILRALAKDWRARFPTVLEFAIALEQALSQPVAARGDLFGQSPVTREETPPARPLAVGGTPVAARQSDQLPSTERARAAALPTEQAPIGFSYYRETGAPPPRLPPPPMELNYLPLLRGAPGRRQAFLMLGYTTGLILPFLPVLLLPSGAKTLGLPPAVYTGVFGPLIGVGILLAGALLGSWRGALVNGAYALFLTAISLTGHWLPFSPFLLVPPVAALLTGWIYERRTLRGFGRALLALLPGALLLVLGPLLGNLLGKTSMAEITLALLVTLTTLVPGLTNGLFWSVLASLLVVLLIGATVEMTLQHWLERREG